MPDLRTVVMGPVEDRRIIGYVDDLGGVYDARQRRIGSVGIEQNARYVIQDASGVVVGSVDAGPDERGGHMVYDPFNVAIGTGFANTFVDAASGQPGLIAFDEGDIQHREIITGAALLLLVHSPDAAGAGPQTGAFGRGAQLAQESYQHLKEEHAQTLAERERLARSGSMLDSVAAQRMKFIATVLVEMIPLGLGPWGIGDVLTLIESMAGRTLDGLKLSIFERLIYLGASAIPVVPARPIVTVYRMIERARAQESGTAGKTAALPTPADLNPIEGMSNPSGSRGGRGSGPVPPER